MIKRARSPSLQELEESYHRVNILLNAGAQPTYQNLLEARRRGDESIYLLLIDRITNPNDLLMKAIEQGDLRVIHDLLCHGADIHYQNDAPLKLASHVGKDVLTILRRFSS